MKSLTNYTEKAQTEAFEKYGAFFAFSNEQFNKNKKPDTEYCNLGSGLTCPKEHAKALHLTLAKIHEEGIAKDIEENGLVNIIGRELRNHECYYTYDITDCVEALEDYPGVTKEKVQSVFDANKHKFNC